jgi:hypothetical protein
LGLPWPELIVAATLPQIVKSAERFMADLELAVARFPRAHRYTLGSDLRSNAIEVARQAHKAWRDRAASLDPLSDAIDDLKLRMQLGQRVHAFVSFDQFEALARSLHDLGRQCGGWRKVRRGVQGQNGRPSSAGAQSPSILSSRAASHEAST